MAGITVGLDFETYSAVDLTVHGLERYVSDPTFRPLCAGVVVGSTVPQTFDWVLHHDKEQVTQHLRNSIENNIVVAHNAGFERAVLRWLGIEHAPREIVDSAVAARVAGANGHLFQASRQLVTVSKMEEGRELMRLFSMPGKYQEESSEFNPQVVHDYAPEWTQYKKYCWTDAAAGLAIWTKYPLSPGEQEHAQATFRMNDIGWPVDRDTVEEMYARYLENQAKALSDFIVRHNAGDFNINSFPQKKKWCAERGIRAKSFDEKNVAKLHAAITKKLDTMVLTDPKATGYTDVLELLELLQVLGGSSLSKLKVILDTINKDSEGVWRLKDQYIHAGAAQTLRTSGRSVQMQNLKRLKNRKDMAELFAEPQVPWTNTELAENIRQVFTSSHEDGRLIVGDFSSVESRGLGYQAGALWKMEAYRQGKDLYKVLAGQIYSIAESAVSDDQRQFGKVGELSCGYGAAGPAVQEFAEKMGTMLTEAEADRLVSDWRAINPEVVAYWAVLDEMIHAAINGVGQSNTMPIGTGGQVIMWTDTSPASLRAIYPKARTLHVQMTTPGGKLYLSRVFHGVHETGRNVRYFKASKSKTGDSWKNHYTDPKTKQMRFYEIYGGKMSGILTQSFCREIFFDQLHKVEEWSLSHGNVDVIGQVHDEIVVDWWPAPAAVGLARAERDVQSLMSGHKDFSDFPLVAEIKSSYRYTK